MKHVPDGTRRVQWRATAESADTGTGPTGAGPTDTGTTATSAAAPADTPGVFRLPNEEFKRATEEGLQKYLSRGSPPDVVAEKHGFLVKLTGEQLQNAEVFPVQLLPPEVVAQNRVNRLAEAQARIAGVQARLALAHPALHPIIELHSPTESLECGGCDGGPDYGGDWPCRTIELILEGI